jgi:hypothetical protein
VVRLRTFSQVYQAAAEVTRIYKGRDVLDGTTTNSASETESETKGSEAEEVPPARVEESTGPIALVLHANHLLDKMQLPHQNFEGRPFSLPLGTETLLCTGAKGADGLLPRACYIYGVVVVSGPCRVGEYAYRSYFDPWVVLPKPVQSSKPWGGPNAVDVTKAAEHRTAYLAVKQIVDALLRYPLARQPLPSSGPTRSEPVQAAQVQDDSALKMMKLECEKMVLEVLYSLADFYIHVLFAARDGLLEGTAGGS